MGGGAEEWDAYTLKNEGRYIFSIGTCTRALQSNATVDFWYDRMVAPQTTTFVLETSKVHDLAFP